MRGDRLERGVLGGLLVLLLFAWVASCAPAAPPLPHSMAARSAAPAAEQARAALTGTVTGPAGAPLGGAVVAAVTDFELDAPDDTPVAFLASSERDGHFRFPELPPGRYGVTASSPGLTAAYGGVVTIGAGAPGPSVALTLGGDGFELSGTVAGDDGVPLAGATVGAVPVSEAENAVFTTTTGDRGRYSLSLPPGVTYFVIAEAPPRPRTYRRIEPVAQTVDLRLDPPPPPRPSDDAVAAWLRASAIPLATVHPGSGLDDLAPLRATIGGARIVALGEATHGSAEIFALKHRLVELLVERMGFTTIAFETGFSEALAVNEHVLTGRGDAATALAGLLTTPFETEEVLALVRWMRRYTEDPAHGTKVRFQGFDLVTPAAYRGVLAYLERVDPAAVPALREGLAPLGLVSADATYGALGPDAQAATRTALAALVAALDANRPAYGARTGAAAWDTARQHARILQQAEASFVDPSLRDPAMADNVDWLVERLPPQGKIVLWAHNAHVSFGPLGFSALGRILRQRHGADYLAIGTSFLRGGFRALAVPDAAHPPTGVSDVAVGPAPEGSLDAALALAKLPLFAIDLRTATGPVRDWLASRMPARSVGFRFLPERQALVRLSPSRSFDALVYLEEVSAAHSLRR
ncbi:MAG: erythromycin esterase family protein [Polyangiaceae bacterium]|nr:erythromycin esterase family protein [Polyangiaceae bacterium]